MIRMSIMRIFASFMLAASCVYSYGFQKAFLPSESAKVFLRQQYSSSGLSMHLEDHSLVRSSQIKIRDHLFTSSHSDQSLRLPLTYAIDHAEAIRRAEEKVAMPWAISIQPESPLLYMPFWEWQLSFMKNELKNLRIIPVEEKFVYNENLKKSARIVNMCFSSDEYRKIRMTYYDAGEGCQVFNSLWYPDSKFNLPVLGIDLLAFNRKKHLAVVDFQPLHDQEDMHELLFEHMLAPVKNLYPSLKGKMSAKFYDETKFFSKEMLFARFESESVVNDELADAFQKYVQMHVQLVRDCPEKVSVQAKHDVLARHAAYDTYSADRDPAVGLFATMFGKEWADEFVHDFLFSLSGKLVEASADPSDGITATSQMNTQNSMPISAR
eukprot:CAMPEP_0172420310 /NCGR_PEP_ID=MMETSP1064-20121228/6700_1 /TAXON_ID=202472 /ORGANISM="Aulacoseira subarctica , Strain CCAP 1002/5" /LENGTH=380 /DNA_ID=CAMNT_0013160229 /DNA_START=47 /DNA_END=1189 /DNA_ORIENTATION=-